MLRLVNPSSNAVQVWPGAVSSAASALLLAAALKLRFFF
jgi:hypothetical protein